MAARARVIDRETLGRVGFTDHAIARFGERSGLSVAGRQGVEPIVRDLLLQEGRVVARPPRWYRSSNAADAYMQAGEWLLFICRRSTRQAGHFDVVTVVNNGDRTTWPLARDRGLIFTPPPTAISAPPRRRAGLGTSIVAGRRLRRASHQRIGRLAAIVQVHRERRSALSAARGAAREAAASSRQRYEQERAQAHARHLRMWGRRG